MKKGVWYSQVNLKHLSSTHLSQIHLMFSSSLKIQPHTLMHFTRCDHPPYSTHSDTNTHCCHRYRSVASFRHNIHITVYLFLSHPELHSTHCSHHVSLSSSKSPSHFLSSTILPVLIWHTHVFLFLYQSCH